MRRFFRERKFNIIISVSAVAVMWLIWVIAYYSVKNSYLVPSFTETAQSFWFDCVLKGSFWLSFLNTFMRALIAFVISFAIAGVLACLCAVSEKFSAFFKPFIVFFRTLPTLAVILLLLVWSSPRVAPVAVTVLVLFPIIHARLVSAMNGIDNDLKLMLKAYGVSKKKAIFGIYLPLISPGVLSQTGADISLSLKVMISAEVMANTYKSLGGMMQDARQFIEIPRLAALTLFAVIAGLIVDIVFSQFVRITDKWNKKEGLH